MEIFTESIEQGLSPPCFSVRCVNSSEERFLGDRFLSKNEFLITYFPKEPENNSDIGNVCPRLFTALEIIYADSVPIRGSGMSYSAKNGGGTFSVRYNFFFYRTRNIEKMGECTAYQRID